VSSGLLLPLLPGKHIWLCAQGYRAGAGIDGLLGVKQGSAALLSIAIAGSLAKVGSGMGNGNSASADAAKQEASL
jgi:hypothetical protein